ncbi:MAG TPA: glycoside hydrolase family 3 N-terminal domain-containing protein [Nocardioides sp.]|uniref:glycoside hydrolase family 3 protein n=1 Tax=Nocardioides sp. TaxID=35761 RepID=UPI002E34E203|nr:glycoside hydrolase family 3 N-terminal domain-containing protein [Nocardioides sp.]HEX5088578.1 glycoside hydrolase family 3 N-terminal domain-containing protein [Nocardioides sp.]
MLRTPRGAVLGTALVAALAVGALQAPGQATTHAPVPPAYQNSKLPVRDRVADLLSRMTLAEKVGQMTQAERADVTDHPSEITAKGLGSVLSGGGSTPAANTPEAWADMVDTFQEAALATRLGIPLLYGVDSVHGHGNLLGATVFPHNIGLGATRDAKLVEKVEHITAEETRASGPQWVFAPCVCVARDDRWGRTYESFGETPSLVERMETAIDGFQGTKTKDLARPDRVLATAKHFAGDGLTSYDASMALGGGYPIDQGIDRVSRADFDRLALAPYWPAVRKHHVGSVMPSFSSTDFNGGDTTDAVKMHANHELITDVLKGQMGFDGFVISDWQGIRQIPGATYADKVAAGVNAGIDMFMEPYSGSDTGFVEFTETLTGLVDNGTVSMDRIDDAVSRILTAKFELGLFEHPFTDRRNIDKIGSKAHRKVARQAVAESQVLLRNRQHTLPLSGSKKQPVYVAGGSADSIGKQAGGWTITWQGDPNQVIPGDTILDGIKGAAKGPVTFSANADAPVPANAAGVVVVGETPYAEGPGDYNGPTWAPNGIQKMTLSDSDRAAVEKVCSAAATCTVLVVSGRPIIIPPELLGQIDALVASWLPGSEGTGVADVLFGKKPFTGKLPMTWPRSLDQEPINVGDADYDPLFRYGFGLGT